MSDRTAEIDRQLVRAMARWALVVTLLLFLLDLAILAGWPFPDPLEVLRGPVYVALGLVVLLGTLALAFLGYRVVSLRLPATRREVMVIFFPAAFLVASALGFLLFTAPR